MDTSSLVTFALALIRQPYAMVAVAAIAGLGAGFILRGQGSKSGSSRLGNLVFFVPRLFIDLLDVIHTKKFKYYGLILALLAIEAFFAFRAASVYYDVLSVHIPGVELIFVVGIVFVAIFLCGYMVVTHEGSFNWQRWLTAIVVVVHDCAGTVWMNYAATMLPQQAPQIQQDDTLKLVLTIGMCALSVLPFVMGKWAEELRPQMAVEMDEEVEEFTNSATRKIKRRAVDRVLRLVNHTDVVQLVQALPSDEFEDFKGFVMPIIAPEVARKMQQELAENSVIVTPVSEQKLLQNSSENSGDSVPTFQANSDENLAQNSGNFSEDSDQELDQLFEQNSQENSDKTGKRITEKLPEFFEQNTGEIQQFPSPRTEKKAALMGLTVQQAARLDCCQKKGLKVAHIRNAIRVGKLRTFSDESLSKNAIEKWAKTFSIPVSAK